jgi:Ca-activated chloride channel family protein
MFLPSLFILSYTFLLKQKHEQNWFKPEVLELLKSSSGGISLKTRNIFGMFAIFLMIVSLSRPVIYNGEIDVTSESVDITIALDISKSMLAEDVYPNRIEFAKRKSIDFLELLDKNRIGIIAFANVGYTVSPMSFDKRSISYLINNLQPKFISEAGTSIDKLLDSAKNFLDKSSDKYLIIFTDGGDALNYDNEIEIAKKIGIKISIVGIGSNSGSPIKDETGKFITDGDLIVISKYNSAIEKLATETDGIIVKASTNNRDIKELADHIKNLKSSNNKIDKLKLYEELYIYPIIIAIILLFPIFFSLPNFSSMILRNRNRSAILIYFALFLSYSDNIQASIFDWYYLKNANDNFQNGNYNEAIKNYKNLQDGDEVNFNIGVAQYHDGNISEAIKYFEKVNGNLKQSAIYNIANSQVRNNELEKAKNSYEEALKFGENPKIRENLEFVKNKLKQKDNNQTNEENQDQNQKEQNGENNPDQNSSKQNKEKSPNQDKDSKDQKNSDQNSEKSDKSESKSENDKNSDKTDKKGENSSDSKTDKDNLESDSTNSKNDDQKENNHSHNDKITTQKNNKNVNMNESNLTNENIVSSETVDQESRENIHEQRIFNILNDHKGGTKIYMIPTNVDGVKSNVKPW